MVNNNTYHSANVLVVSNYGYDKKHQPIKYVLFGLTQNGTLSSFGGNKEKWESNPKDTASREAVEETIGVIGSNSDIRNTLRGIQPSSGSQNGHYTYVLPGKYYGDHISARFKQIRFDPKAKLNYSQKEMVDIVPVKVEDIYNKVIKNQPLVFKDNNGNFCSLRDPNAVIKAINGGYLKP